jgi:hypothetical protein
MVVVRRAGWHGNKKEGCKVLLSRGGGSTVHAGAIGNTQVILQQWIRSAGNVGRGGRGGLIETLHDQYFN